MGVSLQSFSTDTDIWDTLLGVLDSESQAGGRLKHAGLYLLFAFYQPELPFL